MADGSKAPPETPEQVIDRLVNPDVNPSAVEKLEQGRQQHTTPQGPVEQLRREGVDAKTMGHLHAILPGFGSPEVQKHFQD